VSAGERRRVGLLGDPLRIGEQLHGLTGDPELVRAVVWVDRSVGYQARLVAKGVRFQAVVQRLELAGVAALFSLALPLLGAKLASAVESAGVQERVGLGGFRVLLEQVEQLVGLGGGCYVALLEELLADGDAALARPRRRGRLLHRRRGRSGSGLGLERAHVSCFC
jgi:hypothetical protein